MSDWLHHTNPNIRRQVAEAIRGAGGLSNERESSDAEHREETVIVTPRLHWALKTTKIYLPVTPMGAPRMTLGDNKARRKGYPARPVVRRYAEYCGAVRNHWPAGIDYPQSNAWIVFHVPMPKGWSKRKKREMAGTLHQKKPDRNNLEKALEDAYFYDKDRDDSHIADNRVTKFWSYTGYIEIHLDALPSFELIKQAA